MAGRQSVRPHTKMMKRIYSYIVVIISLFNLAVLAQNNQDYKQNPKIVEGTSYSSDSLNYQMLGYENNSYRFWIIIRPKIVTNRGRMREIIQHVYTHNRHTLMLDSIDWNISFFSSSEEAGYKTFSSKSYLAEYSREKNKVQVYPALSKQTFWYYGPSSLSIRK